MGALTFHDTGNKDVPLEIMVSLQVLLATLIFICRAGKGQGKM